jgi:hypothetical protein
VRGGYRLNEYWAFEGLHEYGDGFDARRIVNGAQIQTNTFMGGAKLLVPLGRFQPYLSGSVGLGREVRVLITIARVRVPPPGAVAPAGTLR